MNKADQKLMNELGIDGAYIPGYVMEFSMEEARERGFFLEDAMSEQDALDSTQGLVFLEGDALLAAIELPYKEQIAAGLYGRVP